MPDYIASLGLTFFGSLLPQGSAGPNVIWTCLLIPTLSSCNACSVIRFCKAPPPPPSLSAQDVILLATHTPWAGSKTFIFCTICGTLILAPWAL